jgi:hypothetical protein
MRRCLPALDFAVEFGDGASELGLASPIPRLCAKALLFLVGLQNLEK